MILVLNEPIIYMYLLSHVPEDQRFGITINPNVEIIPSSDVQLRFLKTRDRAYYELFLRLPSSRRPCLDGESKPANLPI